MSEATRYMLGEFHIEFKSAFKALTGYAPLLWQETLQIIISETERISGTGSHAQPPRPILLPQANGQ